MLHNYNISPLTVPSEPLNVTTMSIMAGSFLVTWSPPNAINAPEINYTVQLTGPNSVVTDITGIGVEIRLLEGLMPFTNYSVVVFAVSEKGPGPTSETQTVRTLEDGEYARLYPVRILSYVLLKCGS